MRGIDKQVPQDGTWDRGQKATFSLPRQRLSPRHYRFDRRLTLRLRHRLGADRRNTALVKSRTGVLNAWVAERLSVGHVGNVMLAVRRVREEKGLQAMLKKLERTLDFRDSPEWRGAKAAPFRTVPWHSRNRIRAHPLKGILRRVSIQ